MTDIAPDYAALIERLNALAVDAESNDDHGVKEACDKAAAALRTLLERNKQIAALEAERDALAAENERLKEDRARFPDKPDDIGRMIEAHIRNLKAGKESAEDLADKAFDRAFRAEAKLAEAIKLLDAIDRVNRGVDWCDQYEQARRWFAARKFLKENGNGE